MEKVATEVAFRAPSLEPFGVMLSIEIVKSKLQRSLTSSFALSELG